MRTRNDRIRHAILFELFGLALSAPLGAWLFDQPLHDMGLVAVVCATIAMVWNYVYNLLFDRAMLRLRGAVHKTLKIRILHAILFELGLLVAFVPFIAWQLGVTLWTALVMDAAFVVFYLVFAFVYNWLYDVIFPIPSQTA